MPNNSFQKFNIPIISLDISRPNTNQYIRAKLAYSNPLFSDLKAIHEIFLNTDELDYYKTLKFEKPRFNYLLGRYIAKLAISNLINETEYKNITISRGVFKQPIIHHSSFQNIQVSISHSNDIGAVLVFPESHPMGIDIEYIDQSKSLNSVLNISSNEEALIKNSIYNSTEKLMLLWTAKEALSKTLKTGLAVNQNIYEIDVIDVDENYIKILFKNFLQYKSISWVHNNYAWSIVLPEKSNFNINIVIEQLSIFTKSLNSTL